MQDDDDDYKVGMTVDTTLIPYGFRVFITEGVETRIYDSNSGAWTAMPSMHGYWGLLPSTLSRVHYNKFLYVLVVDPDDTGCYVHTYDFENYVWNFKVLGVPQSNEWWYGGIGVWQDRCFAFGLKPESVLTVWQMNTDFEEPWTVFDCMPKDLCKWMMRDLEHQIISITFCDEIGGWDLCTTWSPSKYIERFILCHEVGIVAGCAFVCCQAVLVVKDELLDPLNAHTLWTPSSDCCKWPVWLPVGLLGHLYRINLLSPTRFLIKIGTSKISSFTVYRSFYSQSS